MEPSHSSLEDEGLSLTAETFVQLYRFIDEARLDKALSCAVHIANAAEHLRDSAPASFADDLKEFRDRKVLEALQRDWEVVERTKELLSSADWLRVSHSAGIAVDYHNDQHSPLHSIRVQGVLDSGAESIVAFLREVDLYETWLPRFGRIGFRRCEEVADLGMTRMVVCNLVGCLPPISDRDALMYAFAADMLDTSGEVMVCARSISSWDDALVTPGSHVRAELPDVPKRVVRVDLQYCGMALRPVSANRTEVRLAFCLDPKLRYVPLTLVNWAAKKLAHYAFVALRERTKPEKMAGSLHAERLASPDRPVYDLLRKRLREKLQSPVDEDASAPSQIPN